MAANLALGEQAEKAAAIAHSRMTKQKVRWRLELFISKLLPLSLFLVRHANSVWSLRRFSWLKRTGVVDGRFLRA